jgi:hypothetical protein
MIRAQPDALIQVQPHDLLPRNVFRSYQGIHRRKLRGARGENDSKHPSSRLRSRIKRAASLCCCITCCPGIRIDFHVQMAHRHGP